MLVSPIFGVMTLGGHDCFCSEFLGKEPETREPPQSDARIEFGFKEVKNRVAGHAEKNKPAFWKL